MKKYVRFAALVFIAIIVIAIWCRAARYEITAQKIESYIGLASWYGPGFKGKEMANGERYNPNEVLVAHREYPFGTKLQIINMKNGKAIVASVKDRGPYILSREVDLSYAAAKELQALKDGIIPVRIIILPEDIKQPDM